MATTIKRVGFGQVEPNHLSAQRTAQIYAQLPAAEDMEILEQGMFVKYDQANGEVNLTGPADWKMVFNEIKLYKNDEFAKDFALMAKNAVDGVITPRVFTINVGDFFTTNTIKDAAKTSEDEIAGVALTVGDKLHIDPATGYLDKAGEEAEAGAPVFQVTKETTMPDGQPAVKVMRIQ